MSQRPTGDVMRCDARRSTPRAPARWTPIDRSLNRRRVRRSIASDARSRRRVMDARAIDAGRSFEIDRMNVLLLDGVLGVYSMET